SPSLYAQFGREILPNKIAAGLKKLGFDDVADLAYECGEISFAIQEYLREHTGPKPVIHNACPTIVRLIQVKYPTLIEHLSAINVPRELAAKEMKKKKSKELGIDQSDIGAFYITPCPVKMISIRQPAEKMRSHLDGAISISDIYGPLLSAMEGVDKGNYRKGLENICILGIGWAIAGGMSRTLRLKNSLTVSGLNEILKVFDDTEMGKLRHTDFIEAYSCHQGCVGGSLTVENLYISYNKILKLIETLEYEKIKACPDIREVRRQYAQQYFLKEGRLEPRPLKPLDAKLALAIKKRKDKEMIYLSLPKIDCGVCGSPTCLAFAEDVVTGEAKLTDCIFKLPETIKNLPEELIQALTKVVPIDTVKSQNKNSGQVRKGT
ncbi:MAG: hypothetical protein JXB23_10645, partial [Candidatus Aminicenantes bacterium]|nr:hypothetical protein [Candidatus Aminicenantes bacterium]